MKSSVPFSSCLFRAWSAAALLVSLAGCGTSIPTKSTVDPLPPATGSNTLQVQAGISGSDSPMGGFVTDFSASVWDAQGGAVSGATVLMTTPDGMVQLMEPPGMTGVYRFSGIGYVPGAYFLDVTRGSDRVSGSRVIAPDIHTIVSPAAYDTVPASSALQVGWSRSSPTDRVVVETRDYNGSLTDDTGATVIPPSGNPPRTDQRIRVIRSNASSVTGGVSGSQFEASIRKSVEPVIAR